MATSLLGPRLIAGLLLVLWVGLAAVLVVGYRVGGSMDALLGGSLVVPCLVAGAAIVRPVGSLDRPANRVIAMIGICAALVLAPLLIDVSLALVAGPSLPVAPSPGTAYAGVLALLGTCLFGSAGLTRRSSGDVASRTRVAAALGIGLTLVGSAAFGGAVVAARGSPSHHPALASAWGPNDPGLIPPSCDVAPMLGPSARLLVAATATIDTQVVGTATIDGVRDGLDERWSGRLDSRFGDGELAYSRVGAVGWWSLDGASPEPVPPGLRLAGPDALTLDGPLAALAAYPGTPTAAEDLGTDLFAGAPARHCRLAVDGDTIMKASVALRWLAGKDPGQTSRALNVWRGQFDWWTFGDGQLGRAVVSIGGYPGDAWDTSGIAATLETELSALDRDVVHRVIPLVP